MKVGYGKPEDRKGLSCTTSPHHVTKRDNLQEESTIFGIASAKKDKSPYRPAHDPLKLKY